VFSSVTLEVDPLGTTFSCKWSAGGKIGTSCIVRDPSDCVTDGKSIGRLSLVPVTVRCAVVFDVPDENVGTFSNLNRWKEKQSGVGIGLD
jgi:hypothetical protein